MPRQADKRVPTLYDVAQLAQVSVATVSHVLNPDSEKYVSNELRHRIVAAASQLDYRPNILARSMRGKRRKTIAIIVPKFENILFTRTVMAAEQVAYDAGYVLLICNTYDNPERERIYIEHLLSQQVDGFIIAPTIEGLVSTKPLRDLKIPYVIVDRQLNGLPLDSYDYIGFDNQVGAEIATQYLIDRGHRDIAFVGSDSRNYRINERYIGFRSAIIRNGLNLANCPIALGQETREEGLQLTNQILKNNNITALLAGHQYLAEGIILSFHQNKIKIPEDLSIIVYGGPAWTELSDPPLTHVKMPDIELGGPAAKNLIDRIEGNRIKTEQIVLNPILVPGQSVIDGPEKFPR